MSTHGSTREMKSIWRTSLLRKFASAGATFTPCRTRTIADAKFSCFGSAATGDGSFGMSCTHTVYHVTSGLALSLRATKIERNRLAFSISRQS